MVPMGTIGLERIRIGVMLGGVQLLMIMDMRVVTCLNITILTHQPFRWNIDNGYVGCEERMEGQ